MFKYKHILSAVLVVLLFALPSCGASFRRMSNQQFWDICAQGSEQEIIRGIKAGADINAQSQYHGTPLMMTAYRGYKEAVKALLKAGADVNTTDEDGWTALMSAVEGGNPQVVNVLLKARTHINVNAKSLGITALMIAAKNGRTQIVNALIKAGADDLTDWDGKTALMYAAEYGHAGTIIALIDAGAYAKAKDSKCKTALDYARENDKLRGTHALFRLEELTK